MAPNSPSLPVPGSSLPPAMPPPASKKKSWLLYGCGTLFGLLLVIVATIIITIWWIRRPIKPVVLSAQEKVAVEQKLQHLGGRNDRGSEGAPKANGSPPARGTVAEEKPPDDGSYVRGSRVFKLTEREINGLLNANTDLGKSVRLEFARNAINAYVAVPIPQDFPIGGGKMFRARGRFRLSLGDGGAPYAILDDVTVFGLSLPKAWLGGLKGENLIDQAVGERNGSPIFRGVKSLRVEPGALVLEVED